MLIILTVERIVLYPQRIVLHDRNVMYPQRIGIHFCVLWQQLCCALSFCKTEAMPRCIFACCAVHVLCCALPDEEISRTLKKVGLTDTKCNP